MTQLRHYDVGGMVRFVTFSCYNRLPLLTNNRIADLVEDEVLSVCAIHQCRVIAYVIMPEHVHLVLLPSDGTQLGLLIREIKSRSARRAHQQLDLVSLYPELAADEGDRRFWLRRCYDHNCRTWESVQQKIGYCHNNPVRRQLVAKAEDWKWSSIRRM